MFFQQKSIDNMSTEELRKAYKETSDKLEAITEKAQYNDDYDDKVDDLTIRKTMISIILERHRIAEINAKIPKTDHPRANN